MLTTSCFDPEAFADNILQLLKDKKLYQRVKKDAIRWARGWDWDRRSEEILRAMETENKRNVLNV